MKNKKGNAAKRMMLTLLAVGGVGCLLFGILYAQFQWEWAFSTAITFGMIAFHMALRFAVPSLLTLIIRNRYQYHYQNRWFRQKKWEPALYRFLRVKDWKDKTITYDPGMFSVQKYTVEQIVHHMCHSELVHESIALLSYTSLFFAIPFGSFMAFFITALIASLIDLSFVCIQRFNRPRLVRILDYRQRTKAKSESTQ